MDTRISLSHAPIQYASIKSVEGVLNSLCQISDPSYMGLTKHCLFSQTAKFLKQTSLRHEQTVQTKIRHHLTRSLIRVYTACLSSRNLKTPINTVDSRSPRDSLEYFEISIPRHIRFAELRKTINGTTTFNK